MLLTLNLLNKKNIFLIVFLFSAMSYSFEYRLGAAFGFGGTGIKSEVEINETPITVNRSDGPGVISISFEYQLDSFNTIGIDQTRGFLLAPFSSGVDFTGLTWRYYYPNVVPSVVASKGENTILIVKEFAPFVGPTIGLARGLINRQNDRVGEVSATGIFFGVHAGADYQWLPNLILRGEMIFGTSLGASGFVKSSLTEFALVGGFSYILD